LDEPTAGLDPHGRDSILRRLKAYQTQSGTAMLFVSHSMEDVARMADRVLVMQNGSVAMIDVPENIYSRTDELAEMGLSVPQITQIFTRLNELGLRVPRGVFTMDSGERILLSLLKGGAV
jgi:energy-coupling factor transport system ATP-binding protein